MSLIPRGFLVAQCDRCQLMLEVDGSEIVFDDINEAGAPALLVLEPLAPGAGVES